MLRAVDLEIVVLDARPSRVHPAEFRPGAGIAAAATAHHPNPLEKH
jgi:hypothetical protein